MKIAYRQAVLRDTRFHYHSEWLLSPVSIIWLMVIQRERKLFSFLSGKV